MRTIDRPATLWPAVYSRSAIRSPALATVLYDDIVERQKSVLK